MRINTGCWVDGCKCFDPDDEEGVEIKCDREWQGLTDEEVEDLWGEPVDCMYSGHYNAIRAIEAKLKEKNNA